MCPLALNSKLAGIFFHTVKKNIALWYNILKIILKYHKYS